MKVSCERKTLINHSPHPGKYPFNNGLFCAERHALAGTGCGGFIFVGGNSMNKAPHFYYEERNYWSGTRLVGMLAGVILLLVVFGIIFLSCEHLPIPA
jgi:hypothetical protein